MPLTPAQISDLAEAFNLQWDLPRLILFAQALNVDLNNLAPAGSMTERARTFIERMSSARPPRDRELLETLQREGNASLRTLAVQLLRRPFFSPNNDEHDAILLGDLQAAPDQTRPFVDREPLRQQIKAFTLNPGVNKAHVLIIHGDQPCGKSYSWVYIRHLADHFNVAARPVRLSDGLPTPRDLVQRLARRLQLDVADFPQLADDPQHSRIAPLVEWFMDRIDRLTQPYWLVIDDLNDPMVTPAVLETVYELAFRVEDEKPKNLWLILLGYNLPITDPDFRPADEAARFPDASAVASHFEWVAAPVAPLTPQRAREIADLLFSAFPLLDKESMPILAQQILAIDLKLANGEQP